MADLKDATLKQLVTERPDLVSDIKAGKDEGSSTVTVIKDAQERMSVWTSERRDIDGVLVGKSKDTYSYYLTGEVDIILQKKYDSQDKLIPGSEKKIKHYLDGRQPEIQGTAVLKIG